MRKPTRIDEKAFAGLANLFDIKIDTPCEIVPDHWLRRPTTEECDQIRDSILRYADAKREFVVRLFESRDERTADQIARMSNDGFIRSSNPTDWRYWVVGVRDQYTGTADHALRTLEHLSRLTSTLFPSPMLFIWAPPDLKELMQTFRGVVCGSSFQSFEYPYPGYPYKPATIDQSWLDSIRRLYDLHESLPESRQNVKRSLHKYHHLDAIGPLNPLYALGLFAIIESLLTHDSKGVYDSLGRQIRMKMQLLNNRFDVPLDDSMFDIAGEKLWKALYEYRSCIAHGSEPNFQDKELKGLKSADHALSFLNQATKKLLAQALTEPDLIADLQEC